MNYAPVFHPGATDIGAAATIALGVSEERTGVDVTIQLVPTATISGTISSPSGALPQIALGAARAGRPANGNARGCGAPRPVRSTAPRRHVRVHRRRAGHVHGQRRSSDGGRGAPPNTPTQWAAADVTVSGQDLDVPLTLQPGVAINGRVVFEGSQPTAAELQALSFASCRPDRAARCSRAAAAAWMRRDASRSRASRPTRITS